MITRPLLAEQVESLDDLVFPLYATPKIDGIRAIRVDGRLVSRRFLPIPNRHIQQECSNLPMGIDGELLVGTTFQSATSGIMSQGGTPDFKYYVFDWVTSSLSQPYLERIAKLERLALPPFAVKLLPERIDDLSALAIYEERVTSQGAEGVMLRRGDGPYKCGRSTLRQAILLKVKKFKDTEGVVVGFEEKQHNDNPKTTNALGLAERSSHKENKRPAGVLGKLIVSYNDKTVGVGTGFTERTREELWAVRDSLIGKVVKYSYFEHGMKDKPRHPSFLGFRED